MSARIDQIVSDWAEIRAQKIKEMRFKDLYFLFGEMGPRTAAIFALGRIGEMKMAFALLILSILAPLMPLWAFVTEAANNANFVGQTVASLVAVSAFAVSIALFLAVFRRVNRAKGASRWYKGEIPGLEYGGFWRFYEVALILGALSLIGLAFLAAGLQISGVAPFISVWVVTLATWLYYVYLVFKIGRIKAQKNDLAAWRKRLEDATAQDVRMKARKLFDGVQNALEKTHASALATMSPDAQFKFKSAGARILYHTDAKLKIGIAGSAKSHSVGDALAHWPEGDFSAPSTKSKKRKSAPKKETSVDGMLYFSAMSAHFVVGDEAYRVGYQDLSRSGTGRALSFRESASGGAKGGDDFDAIRYDQEFLELPPIGVKSGAGARRRPKLMVDDIVLITSLLRYLQAQPRVS